MQTELKQEILKNRLMEAVGKGRGGARRRLNKGGKVGGGDGGGGSSRHHQPAGLQEQCQCPPSLVILVPIVKFKLLQEQYPPSLEYY